MAQVLYLGDEVTAAGLRLAGVETRAVDAEGAERALREALAQGHECVLLSGRLAEVLPEPLLRAALDRHDPVVGLVPDVLGRGAPPDIARVVRSALGIDA